MHEQVQVRLGLRANWPQFALLIVVNVFVGGMVGLERTTTSLIGTRVFHLSGYLAVFSFIVAFGVAKALTNLATGPLTARTTRKNLLVVGWALGLPVPFVLAWAPGWSWIVAANLCLGANQGLTSSMVVNMKFDLVGARGRGLAMGLNEAAGYLAVGATALATGYLASVYGLRPVPELIGVGYAIAGLALSVLVVRDTGGHAAAAAGAGGIGGVPANRRFAAVVAEATWRNRPLRGICQAGLANNLNDGLTWAVFPLLFASHGLGLAAIGLVKGLYPMLWGGCQLVTGPLADAIGRRPLIVGGMVVQATAFPAALILLSRPLLAGLVSAVLLGIGTALAQPALSAAVADYSQPAWRPHALGVYRFWRDLGYAIGAIVAGLVAQALGLSAAVLAGGALTLASALLAARWIPAASKRASAGAKAEQQAAGDHRGRARNEHHETVGRRVDRLQDVGAVDAGHGAEQLVLRDRVAGPDGGLPPSGGGAAKPEEPAQLDRNDVRSGRAWFRLGDADCGKNPVQPAHMQVHRGRIDDATAARLGDDRRDAGLGRRRARRPSYGPALPRLLPDDVAEPVADG
jgi:MFS family permease